MKVVDYQILRGETSAELAQQVLNALQKGWQPLGGVCVNGDRVHTAKFLYQAVVLYEQPT